jgi:hypothetical protein
VLEANYRVEGRSTLEQLVLTENVYEWFVRFKKGGWGTEMGLGCQNKIAGVGQA